MIACAQKEPRPSGTRINWGRIVNYLAGKAFARRYRLPSDEIRSLAGLAVAMARASFDPAKATCSLGVWTCGWGWLRLRSLIRDELVRRRRERAACFTDCVQAWARRPDQDADSYALGIDTRDALWSLQPDWLEWLSLPDRRLVELRADGCTLAEISTRLGQTTDVVRRRLAAIRRLLARVQDRPPGRACPAGRAS